MKGDYTIGHRILSFPYGKHHPHMKGDYTLDTGDPTTRRENITPI